MWQEIGAVAVAVAVSRIQEGTCPEHANLKKCILYCKCNTWEMIMDKMHKELLRAQDKQC